MRHLGVQDGAEAQRTFGCAATVHSSDNVCMTYLVIVAFIAIIGSLVAALADSVMGLLVGRALQGAGAVSAAVTALLADLKAAGKTVILATSKPEAFARRIMEHFDLAQYCDFICGATLDETRTDKAEVIAYALETAGITDKTGLVMVGDREHDVLGAKKNGLPCIGAVYGYGTAGELTAAGAAALAETVEELHKLLLG